MKEIEEKIRSLRRQINEDCKHKGDKDFDREEHARRCWELSIYENCLQMLAMDLMKRKFEDGYEASREKLENIMNKLYKWQGIDGKTGELMYKSYELGRKHEEEIIYLIKEWKGN